MKILLDNGHGENTAGKRSPDGVLREYRYTRDITQGIERELRTRGYDVTRIVKESIDVPLSERVCRVNEWCKELGASRVLLVSVHVNASGDGSEWQHAHGWSAYTCNGKTRSDKLADWLYAAAERNFCGDGVATYPKRGDGIVIRRDMQDGDPDWEEDFYILKQTRCAAVLTENFFMDNPLDMAYLMAHKDLVVKVHVEGIVDYVKSLNL